MGPFKGTQRVLHSFGFRSELSEDRKPAASVLEGKEARGRSLPQPSADTGRLETLLLPPEASYPSSASVQCGLTFKCSCPEDISYVHGQKQFSACGPLEHAGPLGGPATLPTWVLSKPDCGRALPYSWTPAAPSRSSQIRRDHFQVKSLYHVAELRQTEVIYSN